METVGAAATDRRYRYWQTRILIFTIVGYALYYFVRKNLSVAMPVMEQELGLSKSQLGLFLTMHGLLYGVSKFLNGFVGDRVNARWMMAAGLTVCGLLTWHLAGAARPGPWVCCGCSTDGFKEWVSRPARVC